MRCLSLCIMSLPSGTIHRRQNRCLIISLNLPVSKILDWFPFIIWRPIGYFSCYYELIDLNMFWCVSVHWHYYLFKAQIVSFLASESLFYLVYECFNNTLVVFDFLLSIFLSTQFDKIFQAYLVYFLSQS